jgi:AI-2 transport protein TqsA
MNKKKVPRPIGIFTVILIITGIIKAGSMLIRLSSKEIRSAGPDFVKQAGEKLVEIILSVEIFFGIEREVGEGIISHYLRNNGLNINFASMLDFITDTFTMTLVTAFFVIIILSGSVNFGKLLQNTLFRLRYSSVKTFLQIENTIIKFVIVKFVVSALTGVGISIMCILFDINFPVFWGLFAFIVNFVQMVGSLVTIILLSFFGFIEIESVTTLLFFILSITGVQIVFGGVLEPIFMGRTFSLNLITVLIMLMLWGFIWGIPGLILAIPVTVFIKIILEQFPKTKFIATLMSRPESNLQLIKKIQSKR